MMSETEIGNMNVSPLNRWLIRGKELSFATVDLDVLRAEGLGDGRVHMTFKSGGQRGKFTLDAATAKAFAGIILAECEEHPLGADS